MTTPYETTPWPSRHPVRFALLVMLALEAVMLLCLGAAKLFLPGVPLLALDLPILLLNALLAAMLLTRLGWWREAGFTRLRDPRRLGLLLPPLLLFVAPVLLVGLDVPPPGRAAVLLLITLLIGFQEEAMFRGVLLHALAPLGTMRAVLGSAALFGVIHLNSLLVGRDPAFVAVQVIASVLGGIGLAALRLRLGSIWPLVALHALNDFLQFSAAGGLGVAHASPVLLGTKLTLAALMALYGLYLLRRTGPEARPAPARGAAPQP